MATNQNKLPKKEYELFTELIKCYENKQYKKGLKLADSILKKHPNHGETEAMKGLICNCLGRKEEGYELVKSGLKHDLKSSVCWHVYGLVYKSDNNFKEAMKCYLNALKFDPESQLILKDLSFLQIQMRDMNGYLNTRGKILECRPSSRQSWIGYALANYFAKDYSSAFENINKYNDTITDRGDAYEENELLLFQNQCLVKMGKYSQAIDHLSSKEASILDKYAIKIKKAELYSYQGKFDIALERWTNLVKEEPTNYRFHRGLQAVLLKFDPKTCKDVFQFKQLHLPSSIMALSSDQKQCLYSYYMLQQFKGRPINRILLELVEGPEYDTKFDEYLTKSLESGIPALFEDVCALIRVPDPLNPSQLVAATDTATIAQHPITLKTIALLDSYIENLFSHGSFYKSNGTTKTTSPANPQAIVWTKYLKAHLLEISGKYAEALTLIDECIDHTPTALDMYVKKSEILQRNGEVQYAACVMEYCRSLDLQDRFLNNKTTEFLLQANRIDDGMATIALFTKHDGDPEASLFDLQCSWYEIELGEAYARTKQYGRALKKYYAILTHFHDFIEDMFDFHGYCIRKSTLRIYTEVLDAQDVQYSHKYYQRAYKGAVSTLLFLLDHPQAIPPPTIVEDTAKDASNEAISKEASTSTTAPSSSSAPSSSGAANDKDDETDDETVKKPVDNDPYGDKLLTKNFLSEANIWSSHLENRLHAIDVTNLGLFAEVKLRNKEIVKAVEALRQGHLRFPDHPEFIVPFIKLSVKFYTPMTVDSSKYSQLEVDALNVWSNLLGEKGVIGYVARYEEMARISGLFSLSFAVAQCQEILSSGDVENPGEATIRETAMSNAAALLLSSMSKEFVYDVDIMEKAITFAKARFSEADYNNVVAKAKEFYPKFDLFKTSDELLAALVPINSDPNIMESTTSNSTEYSEGPTADAASNIVEIDT